MLLHYLAKYKRPNWQNSAEPKFLLRHGVVRESNTISVVTLIHISTDLIDTNTELYQWLVYNLPVV